MRGAWDGQVRVAVGRLCTAVSLAALLFGIAACGSATKDARVASTAATGGGGNGARPQALPPAQTVKSDGDGDNPKDPDGNPDPDTTDGDDDSYTPASRRYPDADDRATLAYGGSPAPAERRKIAGIATRYYAAAAAADGATACALIIPSIARTVPRDYGAGAGPAYLRGGKTCVAVMRMLFKHEHGALSAAPKLLSVRTKGDTAQVVVGSAVMPASLVYLRRQGAAWHLQSLLGSPLP